MSNSMAVLIALLASNLAASPAVAQETFEPIRGQRVRLLVDPGSRIVGQFLSRSGDILVVERHFYPGRSATDTIAFSSIRRFELSAGKRRHGTVGALVGLGAVVALGLSQYGFSSAPSGEDAFTTITLAGPVFVLTGGVIGLLITTEKWIEVRLPAP